MTTFVQLHTITAYGPCNLNRDELGRPKTVTLGGVERARVSSQCAKRAWRTSEVFEAEIGVRMRGIAEYVATRLSDLPEANAKKGGAAVAAVLNSGGKESKDLVMLYSPRELERAVEMGRKVATGAVEKVEPADVFSRPGSDAMSADVALWGRMLAVEPTFNVMAACSVAHAMTTHRAVIEDDYFTAVDDLNPNGAGHLSARQFTSGVFYNYVTVNMDLLHSNLGDDEALVEKTIRGLIRAACTVSPTGMKSSFASYSQAAFALLEIGSAAPRSLASAFVRPVYGQDQIADSIKALRTFRKSLDAIYGPQSHASTEVDVTTGRGTLDDLVALATGRAVAHTEAAE